jgi:NAD(P)-dependent dehydrogenase (short-subunit alcohol dehydrogenase family)
MAPCEQARSFRVEYDQKQLVISMRKNWEALAGKRCLVTGGSSGIGLATVTLLHANGAHIVTCARGQDRLDAMADATGGRSKRLQVVRADVSNSTDLEALFGVVDDNLGKLDVLITNAAIAGAGVMEMGEKQISDVLASNLFGQIACIRRGLCRMSDGGRIVLIGSMSADVREEEGNVYVASKAGLQGFAGALRKQASKRGIHVHLVEPGSVATPLHGLDEQELADKLAKREMLTPEEIAECIAFIITRSSACDIVSLQVRPHKQFI